MVAKRRVRIEEHGRVPLPADLMRRQHLKTGDEVALEETDRGVLMTLQAADGSMGAALEPARVEPGPDVIARRRAAVERILSLRAQTPSIAPFTTADLLHIAREDTTWYGDDED